MKCSLKRILASGLMLLGAVLLPDSFSEAAVEWKLAENRNGICTYVQDVPDSDFDRFKGTAVVDASMAVIAAVLRDLPAYPEWMPYISLGRIVKRFDSNNMIVYGVIDFPWPVSDRDMILQSDTTFNPDTGEVWITSKALGDPLIPLDDGMVRIEAMLQQFVVEFIEKDKTRISYILHMEPKGRLPAALVNLSMKSVPSVGLAKLRQMALKEKYQAADIMEDGNFEITKALMAFHLEKNGLDGYIIETVCADEDLIRFAVNAGISKSGARRVVARVLETRLRDQALLRCLVKDEELAAAILRDQVLIQAIARDEALIEFILNSDPRSASRIRNIVTRHRSR